MIDSKQFDIYEFLTTSLQNAERELNIVEQSIEKNIGVSSAYAKRIADISLELTDMRTYLDYCIDFYGEGRVTRDLLDKIDSLHKRREGIIATRNKTESEIAIATGLLEEIQGSIAEIKYYIHNHRQQENAKRLCERAGNESGEEKDNDTTRESSE